MDQEEERKKKKRRNKQKNREKSIERGYLKQHQLQSQQPYCNKKREKRRLYHISQLDCEVQALQYQAERLYTAIDTRHHGFYIQIVDICTDTPLNELLELVGLQIKTLENLVTVVSEFESLYSHEPSSFRYRDAIVTDILKSEILGTSMSFCAMMFVQQQFAPHELLKIVLSMFNYLNAEKLKCSEICNIFELIELLDEGGLINEVLFKKSKECKLQIQQQDLRFTKCPQWPVSYEFNFKAQFFRNRSSRPNNVEDHLSYHFYLIREDYLREFREAIFKIKSESLDADVPFKKYCNLILRKSIFTNQEIFWEVSLNLYEEQQAGKSPKIDWFKSKRLASGSLLAITNQNGFPLIFASIVDRDKLQPEFNKSGAVRLNIKLCGAKYLEFFTLIKGSTIVLEHNILYDVELAYLRALQTMDLAFKPTLVQKQNKVRAPQYQVKDEDGDDVVDLNYYIFFSLEAERVYKINMLERSQWLLTTYQKYNTLDQSQMDALQIGLQSEIAIIQGPPGTGKTYCGALIVKNLILNRVDGPILIVCYTNHALDQFLLHILKFVEPEQVARIGGGSKDPEIQQLVFRARRDRIEFEWDRHNEIKERMKQILAKIEKQEYLISLKTFKEFCPNLNLRTHIQDPVQMRSRRRKTSEDYDSQKGHELDYYLLQCWTGKQIPNEQRVSSYGFELKQFNPSYFTRGKLFSQTAQMCYQRRFETRRDFSDDELEEQIEDEYLDSDEDYERLQMEPEHSFRIVQQDFRQWENNGQNTGPPFNYEQMRSFLGSAQDPWSLHNDDIDYIIEYLQYMVFTKLISKLKKYEKMFQKNQEELEEIYNEQKVEQLNQKKIIGATISGAARFTKVFRDLTSKVLLIEEAAEVLDSHLTCILTSNIQHLILIGDHQQLKPKLKCYALERELHANQSLFERLINQKVPYVMLSNQRRMKPAFADLIRLVYGKNYLDYISDEQRKTMIFGIPDELLFFSHSWPEQGDGDSCSKCNPKEAGIIVAFAQYLLKVSVGQDQISILATYLRQAQLLKKMCLSKNLPQIKVQTVDNYQGEENDIILLSIVRSNKFKKLGYLKIENRINVALSRARIGMFIFGNFEFVRQSAPQNNLWHKVIDLAEKKKVLRNYITFECVIHKNKIYASTPEQINQVVPGCCREKCNLRLAECTHSCELPCHYEGNHQICKMQCNRILSCSHKCAQKCIEKCICQQKVEKKLPCGHSAKFLCPESIENYVCTMKVIYKFSTCSHVLQVPCNKRLEQRVCKMKCEKRLACDHQNNCTKLCYQPCDPCQQVVLRQLTCLHIVNMYCCEKFASFKCSEMVRYNFTGCNHFVMVECQNRNQVRKCQSTQCEKNLPCGHLSQCKKLCCQPCDPCEQLVSYTFKQCNHVAKVKCHQSQLSIECHAKCDKPLNCGHENVCKQPCCKFCDPCMVKTIKQLPCGHEQELHCSLNPRNAICSQKVKFLYKDCNHVIWVECREYQSKRICASQECGKTKPCGHPNKCSKPCSKPCDPCTEKVLVTLKCGHSKEIMCCEDPAAKPCKEMIKHKFASCGHEMRIFCYEKNVQRSCKAQCVKPRSCGHANTCTQACSSPCDACQQPVEVELPCGHKDQLPCHTLKYGIPSVRCHQQCMKRQPCGHPSTCQRACFQKCSPCEQPCSKSRECGHPFPCTWLCYEQKKCSPCETPVQKLLPCGHTIRIICSQSNEKIRCNQHCTRAYPCGHDKRCTRECSEICDPCLVTVFQKRLCGHLEPVICSKSHIKLSTRCMNICKKTLHCGHENKCQRKCWEPCTPCEELDNRVCQPCGHIIQVQCHLKTNNNITCPKPCQKVSNCVHRFKCTKKCGEPCVKCQIDINVTLECREHTMKILCSLYDPKMKYTCNEKHCAVF